MNGWTFLLLEWGDGQTRDGRMAPTQNNIFQCHRCVINFGGLVDNHQQLTPQLILCLYLVVAMKNKKLIDVALQHALHTSSSSNQDNQLAESCNFWTPFQPMHSKASKITLSITDGRVNTYQGVWLTLKSIHTSRWSRIMHSKNSPCWWLWYSTMGWRRCTSLQHILIPNTIKAIKEGASQTCRQMKIAILYNGLEEIGDRAFWMQITRKHHHCTQCRQEN